MRFALALLLVSCGEPKICRTCGSHDPEEASTLVAYAQNQFKLEHAHRWMNEKELDKAMEAMRGGTRLTLVRPWDKESTASVVSIVTRFEAYKAGLGRLFLATWLDPVEETESNFKTAYLGILVMNEKALMYDKSAEQLTLELYEPLLIHRDIDGVAQEKLKTWVFKTLKK